jgi:hypothetical protein
MSPRAASPRLALAPGAHLTRHDGRHLRIGSHPGVVIEDTPVVRALVGAIDGVRTREHVTRLVVEALPSESTGTIGAALRHLEDRGAVVVADRWNASRAPRAEVLSAVLRGQDTRHLSRRGATRLTVHTGAGCDELGGLVRQAARVGGIGSGTAGAPHVQVVVTAGEPHRDTIDALGASGSVVLPVVLGEGRALVGPWIAAGHAPCLRCADAARATWDPSWAHRWPSLDRVDRSHGVGVDVLLPAAGLVVADVLAACDGRRPHTLGTRTSLGPHPSQTHDLEVAWQPGCPCHLLTPGLRDGAADVS